ncbi:MAG: CTP synthase [bacterium]|nr:CTP synthase [bacterium]
MAKKTPKFIFIAGGVMSGVGKGITTASIGRILIDKGFKATALKIDPYVNVDAGTMNPIEHGEVFVMDDGTECDQDIGNYERFMGETLTTNNYMTTGTIYRAVIEKERNLEYGGRCVEVVPDIPNEVIRRIKKAQKISKADFTLIEIGGTIGEYQNLLFLEAARLMKLEKPESVVFVVVSYIPIPSKIGEMKTKPTQYAIRTLNGAGLNADFIIARSERPLDEPRKRKISIFCNINPENVISAPDIESIYQIPINFEKDGLGNKILKKFKLRPRKKNGKKWLQMFKKIEKSNSKKVKIGMVGKYFKTGDFTLMDSYISVIEAIKHAGWKNNCLPEITWLSSEDYEKNPKKTAELKNFDGIIVPGGFGNRGIEGKILAVEFCRKNKIPFLGLCLGMQMAVVEFARNVAKLKNANSTEFDKNCQYPVIDFINEQRNIVKNKNYGGTMRLGAYNCKIKKNSRAFTAYKKELISERHRHRYEFNNKFRDLLESKGLVLSGANPEKDLIEIVEIKNHPFFVGTQFHPEFKSNPLNPHPLFVEFIKSSLKK